MDTYREKSAADGNQRVSQRGGGMGGALTSPLIYAVIKNIANNQTHLPKVCLFTKVFTKSERLNT